MSRCKKLIQFYLTNFCNSHCNTCNIWKDREIKEIDFGNVLKVITEFPDADYVFGGGEFTLYSFRHSLIDFCDRNNISYTVLSNAVSLKRLEELIYFHNIKNLTMSCDGVEHDVIRGVNGNLKNIEYIVSKYKDKIENIKLSYTLSKLNENNIDKDMAYFKSIGFNKIYFCIAQNMDLLKAEGSIVPSIDSLIYFYNNYSDMLYDKDKKLLKDFIAGIHKKCDSIRDVHTIYTNGDAVRCQSFLSNVVIGNIYENSFREILRRDLKIIGDDYSCPYNDKCELVCQRRYDYVDNE